MCCLQFRQLIGIDPLNCRVLQGLYAFPSRSVLDQAGKSECRSSGERPYLRFVAIGGCLIDAQAATGDDEYGVILLAFQVVLITHSPSAAYHCPS